MDIKDLSNVLKENGIVGAGGAGFPTYAKIDARAETIILNCCECEPLLKLHRQLLEKYSYQILETFNLIRETVGAKEGIIGIKKAYKSTIDALNLSISSFKGITIKALDEVYPAGDEVVLIYEATGKVVRPGGLPIESGVTVFNVETVYNLYQALNGKPVTEKYVSVVAEVNNPVTVKVPIGTKLSDVVQLAGGESIPNAVYLVGGPMMGRIMNKNAVVTKTTNAILVLPPDHILIKKRTNKIQIDLKRAAASCCQCSMCTDLCPRHNLGHPIDPSRFMRAAICKDTQDVTAFTNTFYCSGCGLCEMYSCNQGLSPRTLINEVKALLRKNGLKPSPDVKAGKVDGLREYKKAPIERLMARTGLSKYDKKAPLMDEVSSVNEVKISLSQHIGAPSVVNVAVGDRVEKGQVIATSGNGLSVPQHASVSGLVTDISGGYITVKSL